MSRAGWSRGMLSASTSSDDRAFSPASRAWREKPSIRRTRSSASTPFTVSAGLRLSGLGELREARRIVDGQLGQDLPVERDAGPLEPGHEDRIREAGLATGRVEARDPQRPREPLLLLAVAVREGPGAEDRLLRRTEELSAAAEVALRLLQHLLATLAGLRPALSS